MPEAEAERMLALKEQFGYHSFKFRIGAECGHDIDQWPGRSEAIVKAMRDSLGDEVTLMVDANSGFTPKKAIETGRMLLDHGVSHYEEPCPYWELDWTRQVTEFGLSRHSVVTQQAPIGIVNVQSSHVVPSPS